MSGAAKIVRERRHQEVQPDPGRLTKQEVAEDLRAAATELLLLPNASPHGVVRANRMLELVAELLTPPRAGWYPRRPGRWRP